LSSICRVKADVLSDIMINVFRVSACLLEKGDLLVAPLQLTSARWQVLGAVALAGKPLTTPQIAESMGVSRQGAQKQLNRMLEEGLFNIHQNPRHTRSPLYALTQVGRLAFDQAMMLQNVWVKTLAEGLELAELESALRLLNTLYARLNTPLPQQGA
jgi:DNA-binding MarR family transcriptional regulator